MSKFHKAGKRKEGRAKIGWNVVVMSKVVDDEESRVIFHASWLQIAIEM